MFRTIIFEKGLRRRPITPVSNFSIDDNTRTACPIWLTFFLCNQGLSTLLAFGTPQSHFRHYGHRLHVWPKVKKGVAEKIIFPHRVGSVTFFGETRDTILSTGEEIRSPLGVLGRALFWRKCLVYIYVFTEYNKSYMSQLTTHMIYNLA